MSEKYQVKSIYEVYSHYRIKICGHLTYLSFTLGVPDTLISNIYAIWLQAGTTRTMSHYFLIKNVLILIKVSTFQSYF